jgi:pyruvate kinase
MIEILCTVGPNSINQKFLSHLKGTRVTTLRINLSHTKVSEIKKVYKKIRKYSKLPICLDTEGAQIRTSFIGRKFLKVNETIKIEKIKKKKGLNLYPNIYNKLKKNHILEIGFENLIIKIKEIKKDHCLAKVISPGFLENNKGVHIQNQKINLSSLTNKDITAINLAKKIGIETYALSFTNNIKDVKYFNKILPKYKKIFKIETKSAVKNFNGIIKNCSRVLIDRGDLSKDVGLLDVPVIQRKIQKIAKKNKKKVFVATNLLESMIDKPYPTRAEINDIYNCLELGANGLVLAAETAIGKWPLECVKLLDSIISKFENRKIK